MSKPFIPVNTPRLDGNEKKYLLECIETGWISSEGPFISRFEDEMAKAVNRKHGIAVCNGTAAIDAVIEALGIGPGDEVILPTFTIISCVSQIVRNGAIPVLVDSDPNTWNMDPEQVMAKITPRTKAIMIVHIYGLPVDADPILQMAQERGIKVIEDAAEMHGQLYKGRPCGSLGDVSIFSFYPNKHITTGEGGMIVTDNAELADQCRSLRNLCFDNRRRFVHERLGWNLRMTNMQAAIGVAQLERLGATVKRKREIGRLYTELLAGTPALQLPLSSTPYADSIYWVFGLVLAPELGMEATAVMRSLAERGVGSRPFFYPIHQQPVLKERGLFQNELFPVAERLTKYGFYLPSGLGLTDDDISYSATQLKEILQ